MDTAKKSLHVESHAATFMSHTINKDLELKWLKMMKNENYILYN